jgi:pyruvate dehydrogenase E2 component (dihydrolipoamide acetyltransferase)
MSTAIIPLTMPKWGIEMTEGTITSWRVREGERIERGAEILDVETEKIVNAVEAPAAGVLRRIAVGEGETRPVGALIGVIADEQTSEADIARFVERFVGAVVSFDPVDESPAGDAAGGTPSAVSATVGAASAAASSSAATSAAPADAAGGDEGKVSPIARRLAERLGVDLSKVVGTGRNGRVSKEDVEAFAAASGASATSAAAPASSQGSAAASEPTRVRMSARRGTIARRLLESKQTIPHFRLDVDVDMGPLLEAKRSLAAAGERITVNDLLLRATALALVQHPLVNAQLEGEEILQFQHADIAIAVAAEAGLVTPILRAADTKPLAAIAAESRELIARARAGELKREEITGGSFTISNLGMHGVTRFDAIINAPQVAILAVGSIASRPVVRNAAIVAAEVTTLTLSADHRVVDGAVGAAFLASLRALIEQPAAL